jgi:Starter unit:ACP transacylase in aflatoxin biosynthesis
VSSAKSLPELIPIATEAVVVALWAGLRALDVRRHVDCCPTLLSWSVVLPGLQEQSALAMLLAFNEAKVCLLIFFNERTLIT